MKGQSRETKEQHRHKNPLLKGGLAAGAVIGGYGLLAADPVYAEDMESELTSEATSEVSDIVDISYTEDESVSNSAYTDGIADTEEASDTESDIEAAQNSENAASTEASLSASASQSASVSAENSFWRSYSESLQASKEASTSESLSAQTEEERAESQVNAYISESTSASVLASEDASRYSESLDSEMKSRSEGGNGYYDYVKYSDSLETSASLSKVRSESTASEIAASESMSRHLVEDSAEISNEASEWKSRWETDSYYAFLDASMATSGSLFQEKESLRQANELLETIRISKSNSYAGSVSFSESRSIIMAQSLFLWDLGFRS